VILLDFIEILGVRNLGVPYLPCVVQCVMISSTLWFRRVTDRRTDRHRAVPYTALT